jgi:hypothetical protein
MILLREKIERDLGRTLEGEFRLPVNLVSPDGERQVNPIVLKVSDLFFTASDKTIGSTDTDFFKAKVSVGDTIRITGSVSNDGDFTVTKVERRKLTVQEAVVDEVAGTETIVINLSEDLVGQVLYDTLIDDVETGGQIVVHKPVVTLRRTSLTRVPVSGESWFVEIPIEPKYSATKEPLIMEKAAQEGASIGFIRLYLTRAVQS